MPISDEPLQPSHADMEATWIATFNYFADIIEDWSNRKGWNSDDPTVLLHNTNVPPAVIHQLQTIHDISKIGLMGTELGEAIEGRRHGDPPSDKIPEYTAQEEELADTIVRIMHYACHRKLRVAEALVAKLAYNEDRPYKHGKLA